HDNLKALMVSAQAFVVVGIALYIARKIEGRRHIGFAIFLILFGVFLFTLTMMDQRNMFDIMDIPKIRSVEDLKNLMDYEKVGIWGAATFLIYSGIILMVAYFSYICTFRSRCNYEVAAVCNDLKERRFESVYRCPIYEIPFNGKTYFLSNGYFIKNHVPKIGDRVRIKINYENPEEFRLVKHDPHESGDLMALGLALAVFGGIFLYLGKKYNLY
ncbi:MAG: hypothetical protein K6G85_01780, partial [Eubacterium sp.]|nr:hypothetical protein [Eubacterium sp.]